MRFFFDCRYVRSEVHDGISRYSASLLAAIVQLQGEGYYQDVELRMLIHDEQTLSHLPDIPYDRIGLPTSMTEPLVAWQINRLQPDVVFSPMQTMGSVGKKYQLILTLHDLIYYRYPAPPQNFAAWLRAAWRLYHLSYLPQRVLLRGADAVATVSETTRQLMRSHRLSGEPIWVIPNAAPDNQPPGISEVASSSEQLGLDENALERNSLDQNSPEQSTPRRGLLQKLPGSLPEDARRRRDIVYMGSFMDYKNVNTLISAINGLPEYRLHMCSTIIPEQRSRLRALANRPGQLVFHQGISDSGYHQLLARAAALVTLSRDEGYGLPLIEAMRAGVPIVVSDIDIFREVSGAPHHGVRLCSLENDVNAAAMMISHIRELEDPETFLHAQRDALAASRRYNWEHSARLLLDAARQLHSSRR